MIVQVVGGHVGWAVRAKGDSTGRRRPCRVGNWRQLKVMENVNVVRDLGQLEKSASAPCDQNPLLRQDNTHQHYRLTALEVLTSALSTWQAVVQSDCSPNIEV